MTQPQITFALTCEACPTQAEGTYDDAEVEFYFRARHGYWSLRIAALGDSAVSGIQIARGIDPTHGNMPEADVRHLVRINAPHDAALAASLIGAQS